MGHAFQCQHTCMAHDLDRNVVTLALQEQGLVESFTVSVTTWDMNFSVSTHAWFMIITEMWVALALQG